MIHLVGHTPGSIALLYDDPDGHPAPVHRRLASSPAASATLRSPRTTSSRLFDDVRAKLFDRLPDETWFYPGHGDDSTLGDERPHLAEWRARGW